ncbi:ABC transporter substrate-binding protein [Kocuria palustris]|uniref:ABC transporter substrate-binding protein n=1 Tax=Kocuria palustris TaxID=71999 RepID=UPI0011A12FAB|nr:ABC transporter substrate-binding protein [Kocuria palustris]
MSRPDAHPTPRAGRRRALGAGAAAAALLLSGCGLNSDPLATGGGASTPDGSVTVGSADFPESQIIAEIYAGALISRGIEADTQLGIGAREAYIGALEDGSIDVVPDYTGNLLTFMDPEATATEEQEILDALPSALPEGLSVLEPAPAQNKDSIVVTQETAEEHGLSSLADIGPLCGEMTFAGPPEFQERTYGLDGLAEHYGCEPGSFDPINDAGGPLTIGALTSGDADAADVFTTTPAIVEENLVVLEDPESNFAAQQVIPLVAQQRLPDGAAEVMDDVSEKLTTEDLIELNQQVSGDEAVSAQQAADHWLKENWYRQID